VRSRVRISSMPCSTSPSQLSQFVLLSIVEISPVMLVDFGSRRRIGTDTEPKSTSWHSCARPRRKS